MTCCQGLVACLGQQVAHPTHEKRANPPSNENTTDTIDQPKHYRPSTALIDILYRQTMIQYNRLSKYECVTVHIQFFSCSFDAVDATPKDMYSQVLMWHPFFLELLQENSPLMRPICHRAMSMLLLSSTDIIFNLGEESASGGGAVCMLTHLKYQTKVRTRRVTTKKKLLSVGDFLQVIYIFMVFFRCMLELGSIIFQYHLLVVKLA